MVHVSVKRRMMVKKPRKQSVKESVIIVDYVIKHSKFDGRKKRTRIKDQQDEKKFRKGAGSKK
jgi:hypothetical protein